MNEENNFPIDSLRNNHDNDYRTIDRQAKMILTLQLLRDTLATTTMSRKKLLRLSGCIKNAIKRIMYCN